MARPLQPEDLYRIRLVEDPQIASDGRRIAYVVMSVDRESYEYRRQIFVVPAEGGEARSFSAGPKDSTPRWSPDGSRITFVRAPSGEPKPKDDAERERGVGKPQVWILPADGGEARQLTFAREGAGEPVFTPEGDAVLYSADVGAADDREAEDAAIHDRKVPAVRSIDRLWHRLDGKGWTYERRQHLFIVSAGGGTPRQLTDGDWDDGAPAFSPDGSQIAFVSDRSEERWRWPGGDVWVLQLESGKLRRLTDESLDCGPPAWSPDGSTIAFTAGKRRHSDGHRDLYLVPASGQESPRRLTDDFFPTCEDTCIDDQRVGHGGPHLYWSADGNSIFFLASGRGATDVYQIPAQGGTPRRLTSAGGRVYGFSLDRAGRRLALSISDPLTPGNLFVQDATPDASARRLSDVNRDLFSEVMLLPPEEFAFKGADDWDMQGWIIRPGKPEERVPAILEIHGGPMAMYGKSFFFEFQMLAGQGFAVVYSNPRGSTGYGRKFSDAVNNDWGGKDFLDLMAGLDAAIERYGIDPARLGVAGGSYGGYMTNWAVSHSDRFKAAVTMRCVSNLAMLWGTSDLGWYISDEWNGAVPWKDLGWLMERSPVTYVEKIKTPLLILHSDSDLRCSIGEAEQLFTALKFLEREVKYVRFEGQSHDLSRNGHPRSRVIRLRLIGDWFRSHIPVEAKREPERVPAGAAARRRR
jgi:dipeptidyl aminopeptidase/acylaminoacyl peptidase